MNIFLGSSPLGWIDRRSIGVVHLHGVYTAYDVQRISYGDYAASRSARSRRPSVLGALHLYLDFVNMFLFLLRLTGGRR